MTRMWRGFVALIVCLGLLAELGDVLTAQADPMTEARVERSPRPIPWPDISLPDVEGKTVSPQSFKGQVMLVNFWTTW